MFSWRQPALLRPRRDERNTVKRGGYAERHWLERREEVVLWTLRRLHQRDGCRYRGQCGGRAVVIVGQVGVGVVVRAIVRGQRRPGVAVEVIIGEAGQVLSSRRTGVVEDFAAGQIDAAGDGHLITEEIGGSLVGLDDGAEILQ